MEGRGGYLKWQFNEDQIEAERLLEGCYVIRSDVSASVMGKHEVVASYKGLTLLEQAFRNLKSVQLEVRPVYHKTDARIRCHGHVGLLSSMAQDAKAPATV